MKRLVIVVTMVLLVLNCGWLMAGEPTSDLRPVLNELMELLSDESQKGDDYLAERREKIMLSISRGFNFREMSKRVLGKTWRKIDENERDSFTRLMTKLLENVYIGKLEGYSGSTIEYAAEAVKGKRAQVTTLVENDGVKLPVHYIMKKYPDGWMVYDINIEGVSLVRNYQQQFKSILRKERYPGLVKVIEKKNHSFMTKEN